MEKIQETECWVFWNGRKNDRTVSLSWNKTSGQVYCYNEASAGWEEIPCCVTNVEKVAGAMAKAYLTRLP